MRKLRDVFYINAYPDNNEIVYYGMEFSEFIKNTPVTVNQLLLILSDYFLIGKVGSKTNFEIIDENEMQNLLREDVSSYGDFCWVDYNNRDNIEQLEPIEIAELLYLGHMYEPLKSPFFDKIQNRYTYLAHDDGWFCRLYCRNYSDVGEILANKIVDTVTTSKRQRIYPVSDDVKSMLLHLAERGLVFDFNHGVREKSYIEIPIYCIGKIINMDDMYNNLNRYINRSTYAARLVHKNKKWVIDYEIIK